MELTNYWLGLRKAISLLVQQVQDFTVRMLAAC
jgi:hypothetical protein